MLRVVSRSGVVRAVASILMVLASMPSALLNPLSAEADSPPVIQMPNWLSQSGGAYVLHSLEGDAVNLQIVATGDPAPALVFNPSVNGVPAVPSIGSDPNAQPLSFTTTSPDATTTIATIAGHLSNDSFGNYPVTIVATNSLGSAALSFIWMVSGVPTPEVDVVLNPVSAIYGDPVNVTATVTAQGVPAITGDVVFRLNGSPLTVAAAVNDQGKVGPVLLTNLPVGNLTIEAHYSGGQAANGEPLLDTVGYAQLGVGKIPTATAVSGSPNPALLGQSITLVAQVTSPKLAAVTEGSVDFLNETAGFSVIGSALVNSAGIASISLNDLALGNWTIRANYSGTPTIDASNKNFVERVQLNPTTTTISTSPVIGTAGQPVAITATVMSNGRPVSSGSVRFVDGTTTLSAAVPLSPDGQAVYTSSPLSAGVHHLSVTYPGSALYDPSTGTLDLTVNAVPTNTNVVVSPSAPTVGQTVTLAVSVLDGSAIVSGGTLTLKENGAVLAGPANLASDGTGALSISTLTAGAHTLTVDYSGTSVFGASTAGVPLTVNASTSVSVTATPASPTLGQPVTLTTAVTSSGAPVTAGAISFTDGATLLAGPVNLGPDGRATATTAALATGSHTIIATYSGATGYAPSSGAAGVTVTPPPPNTSAITVSANPNPAAIGQTVSFAATVTAGSSPATSGAVTLKEGGTTIAGPTTVDATGKAALSASFAGAGVHTLTAEYSGAAGVEPASTSFTVTANAATNITSTLSASPAMVGQQVTFTVAVRSNAGTPQGAVLLSEAGATLAGPITLAADGSAQLRATFTAAGAHTLTVEYGGGAGFSPSTATLTLDVKAATTIVVATSPVAPVAGQTITFTATVLSGGQPVTGGGAITMSEGGLTLGPVSVGSNGQAVLTTAGLTAGAHTLSVAYSGAAYYTSSSTSVTLTVSPAATTTVSVASSPNASLMGQPVTVTATVLAGGAPVTAGTVSFSEGSTVLAPGAGLNSQGQASFVATGLSAGNHTMVATYSGAPGYAGGQGSVVQAVNLPPSVVTATYSPAVPVQGQPTTFSVLVTSYGYPVTTDGPVSIKENGVVLAGPVPLNNIGQATFVTVTLVAGAHTLVVDYGGNPSVAPNIATLTVVVQSLAAATLTNVSYAPAAPTEGQTVTFNVSVTSGGQAIPPEGVATITEGSTTVAGPVAIDRGGAVTLTAMLAAGAHNLTATYGGSTNFAPSSRSVTVTVGPSVASTTLTAGFSPVQPAQGDTITFTAAVASNGVPVTAGTVTVNEGATVVAGPVALGSDGRATLTNSTLTTGGHTLTVAYSGAAGYAASSATISMTVAAAASPFGLRTFVVLSQEFTWIKRGAQVVSGSVGANQALPEGGRRAKPGKDEDDEREAKDRRVEVLIGENVQVSGANSHVVGDTVWLYKGSKVVNVAANELLRNKRATITGATTDGVKLPLLTFPAPPTFAPGRRDIEVNRNQAQTLPAGSYRSVVVRRDATLTLTGGLYQIESLQAEQNSTIAFTAATDLRIANELAVSKGGSFGPATNATMVSAHDIRVTVGGGDDRGRWNRDDDDEPLEDGEVAPTAVQVGQNVTLKANVYAPKGTIWVKRGATATGAFIGKRVQIGENVKLTLDSAFGQ